MGGDNWMFSGMLVGDEREFSKGIIVSCRLEEHGVWVVMGFGFEGFYLVGRFLKLYNIISNLFNIGSAGFERFTHKNAKNVYV